jgi:hypothetical protein
MTPDLPVTPADILKAAKAIQGAQILKIHWRAPGVLRTPMYECAAKRARLGHDKRG